MFTYTSEHSFEVDVPIEKLWRIFMNPTLWPKWMEQIKSCEFQEPLKVGSVVKCNINSIYKKNAYLNVHIEELVPCNRTRIYFNDLLVSQKTTNTFQELTPNKTHILIKNTIGGIGGFLTKCFFQKKTKEKEIETYAKFKTEIESIANQIDVEILKSKTERA